MLDETNDQLSEEGHDGVPGLEQDNDPPFSLPVDTLADSALGLEVRSQMGRIDPMHQATDSASDIDSHQLYDEGLAGAAEASEPNAGNAVVGYDPENDSRRSQ